MAVGVPAEILQHLKDKLSLRVQDFQPSSGGCINHGGRLKTAEGIFFIKWNEASRYPGMFQAEAKGLQLLDGTQTFRLPKVIASDTIYNLQFLLLEFIQTTPPCKNYWKNFGSKLANLHRQSGVSFGLDHDNYIGSLPQYNNMCHQWVDFFIHHRLQVQLDLAVRGGLLNSDIQHQFEKLYLKLPAILPHEQPSLIHGDLWSGNLMIDDNGEPCLIDPACYFGNREADIAMTMLFGGFDMAYLQHYHAMYPLLPDYRNRLDLYNLYPLLVHVNLFGKSYAAQVVSILRYFV